MKISYYKRNKKKYRNRQYDWIAENRDRVQTYYKKCYLKNKSGSTKDDNKNLMNMDWIIGLIKKLKEDIEKIK